MNAPLACALALSLTACQQADSSQAVPGDKVYYGNPGVRSEMAARLAGEHIQHRIERDGTLWYPSRDRERVSAIQAEVLHEVHLRASAR